MKKKLLIICGPSATGKTTLAIKLCQKINGEIISADSRQVYRKMDIGTGKDLNKNFELKTSDIKVKNKEISYYKDGNVRIWGYDLVNPDEEFNVSQYIQIAEKIMDDIFSRNKNPVIVGGTGLYIKALVDGIDTAIIPIDKVLRDSLIDKTQDELYDYLATLDPVKAASLNSSDRKNPRRLIRAIEVAQWIIKKGNKYKKNESVNEDLEPLFIGLNAPKQILYRNIENRVQKRVAGGFEDEILGLLKNEINWNFQSMQSLGYKDWKEYFLNKTTKEMAIENWITSEKKYVKRQLTWFNKEKRINWYSIEDPNYEDLIEKKVEKWYSSIS